RDARQGGGVRALGPDRADEVRPAPAGRVAGGALPHAGEPVPGIVPGAGELSPAPGRGGEQGRPAVPGGGGRGGVERPERPGRRPTVRTARVEAVHGDGALCRAAGGGAVWSAQLAQGAGGAPGGPVRLMVRPESLVLVRLEGGADGSSDATRSAGGSAGGAGTGVEAALASAGAGGAHAGALEGTVLHRRF